MNERPGYKDAEAKQIIQRAAEIDAERGRELDAAALREIASEAGISPVALDQAIREHGSTTQASSVSWLRRHRVLLTVGVIIVALMLVTFVQRAVVPTALP
jgi:hypothetical protein